VVHGTSAGAVVAALLCTRTDAELLPILEEEGELFSEMGPNGPFHGSARWKLSQLLTQGRVYDWDSFHRHMAFFSRGCGSILLYYYYTTCYSTTLLL
jgi:predicted acylesterase/phospholipase RssA